MSSCTITFFLPPFSLNFKTYPLFATHISPFSFQIFLYFIPSIPLPNESLLPFTFKIQISKYPFSSFNPPKNQNNGHFKSSPMFLKPEETERKTLQIVNFWRRRSLDFEDDNEFYLSFKMGFKKTL